MTPLPLTDGLAPYRRTLCAACWQWVAAHKVRRYGEVLLPENISLNPRNVVTETRASRPGGADMTMLQAEHIWPRGGFGAGGFRVVLALVRLDRHRFRQPGRERDGVQQGDARVRQVLHGDAESQHGH